MMKNIEDLQQFYQQEIVPGLSELEILRKAQLRRLRFMWIATVVSLLLGFITLMPPLILVFLLISLLLYFSFSDLNASAPILKQNIKKLLSENSFSLLHPI